MTRPRTGPHKVWRFGPGIDTDQLAPGAYMKFGIPEIGLHCLENVRPDFSPGVAIGDVLVAGPNFGIGSSREQAASVLVSLGIAAVVAPSFGGLYFRNAFNVGLLALTCKRAEQIPDQDHVEIDLSAGKLICSDGTQHALEHVPDFLMEIVDAGGLFNLLKTRSTSRQGVALTTEHLKP